MRIGHGRHEEMLSLPRATDMFDEEKVPSKFGVFPLSGLYALVALQSSTAL
jgi:hypothetical protein